MVKYTVTGMREFVTYPSPGKTRTIVHVDYTLDTGYVGALEIPKEQFSAEKIHELVKAGIKPGHELIGKTTELK